MRCDDLSVLTSGKTTLGEAGSHVGNRAVQLTDACLELHKDIGGLKAINRGSATMRIHLKNVNLGL